MLKLLSKMFPSVYRVIGVLALCLGLGASVASADVIFELSLPENGEFGGMQITWLYPTFPDVSGLSALSLDSPSIVSVTSVTPPNLSTSLVGIDILAGSTLIGVNLNGLNADTLLLNLIYPNDFFVFSRNLTETGTFQSIGGLVTSDLNLGTTTPIATLRVTDTAAIPEPAAWLPLGAVFCGMALLRKRRGLSK